MGGTVALLAAARTPAIARRLVLIDPVILPRGRRLTPATPEAHGSLVRAALRRRRDFSDRAAAVAAYRDRGAFAGWSDAMLADYVDGGLSTTAATAFAWPARRSGRPPTTAPTATIPGTRWLPIPGRDILRAGEGSTCAVDERVAAAFPRLTLRTVLGAAHFLPMQAPDLVRAALAEALAAPA